jgi:hypothetical protein
MHEAGPVQRICLPDGSPVWYVTRYGDAVEALKDRRLVRNRRHAGPDYTNEMLPEIVRAGNLHMEDGQVHTRLRQFMNWAFAPKRVAKLEARARQLTTDQLDKIAKNGGGDIMADLAAPLPITITTDILGVPDHMRGPFREWSDAMLGDDSTPEKRATAQTAGRDLLSLVNDLIDLKRREPADDLISYWLNAHDYDGDPLTGQEMVGMTFFLLLGGYDTTLGQIGTSTLSLINHPEIARRMREDPEIVPAAVEELARFEGSTHTGIRRFALEDLTIGDAQIATGQVVLISLAAANRDGSRFDSPTELRLDREDSQPLTFGRGVHQCPGKDLARMELQVALGELASRFPNIACAIPQNQLIWRRSWFIRVLRELPVTV